MAETPKNSKPSKRTESWWSKNWFYITLVLVAVIGGGCAFTLPYHFQREGDNIWSLRQAILAATGGVLAILTLWENRRKNIQEKEKNDQDHTRQVHAERRARYAKAIEQLADDKSAIRLGGVYTLAKLVDDWLDDEKTLPSMEKRRQEGQIIIDSLCAYIRSSFPLAERHDELTLSYEEYQQKYQGKNQAIQSVKNSADNSTPKAEKHQDDKQSSQSHEEFVRDKSLFREEKEVRQTILSEIKKRLNGGEVKHENGKNEIKPGTWSYFEYNFSDAHFFYAVNFNNSYFDASLNFLGATFTGEASFSEATFTGYANFSGTTFTQDAEFRLATFTRRTDFSGATFTQVIFSGATFAWTDFYGATFTHAFFIGVTFTRADFTRVSFTHADFHRATFTHDADFTRVSFTHADFRWVTFTHDADFTSATFTGEASFIMATFTGYANFSGATFTQRADFSGATFTGEASFLQGADFRRVTFHGEPSFIGALGKARFSYKVIPEDYRFEVDPDSPCKIETEEKEYNGVKFRIPKGAILFDPDGSSEQKDDNDS